MSLGKSPGVAGSRALSPLWLAAFIAVPLHAQTAPDTAPAAAAAANPDDVEDDEITVTAQRQRGTVLGDIAPEVQLGPSDIRAIGAGSIEELLAVLAPQTTSGRGRDGAGPVTLVNGKRISSFAEIRTIPPEAIERIDILPEEVALKYGYRADQRVVNFVLRERFRALTSEVEFGGPTAGGRSSYEAKGNILRIRKGVRMSIEGEYTIDTMLLESERDILPVRLRRPYDLAGNITAARVGDEIDPSLSALAGTVVTVAGVPAGAAGGAPGLPSFVPGANNANVTDISQYRSLLPETRALKFGGVYAGAIGDTPATITAGFESTSSESRLGLPAVVLVLPAANPYSPFSVDTTLNRYGTGALVRSSDSWTGRIGTAINGRVDTWNWNVTANYSHSESDQLTDRRLDLLAVQNRILVGNTSLNPFGPQAVTGALVQDIAKSNTDVADADIVTNGSLFALPAGDLTATFKFGGSARSIGSESRWLGIYNTTSLSRTQGNFQGNFDLPIASVRNDTLSAIGNLSANLNIAYDQLSDFGTLRTIGYGLTWRPIDSISLIASATHEEGAPTIQQLGNPTQVTPNVRVFDFIAGTTVDISRVDGGNPTLVADNRRVFKLGATIKPLSGADLTLIANFVDSHIDNSIAAFPTATAELEAAFPGRFIRDGEGRLLQIDNRPVNFVSSDRQELRWGINFSEPLEPSKAERDAAATRRAAFEAQRAAGGAPGAPGGPSAAGSRGDRPAGGFGGPGGPGGGRPGGRGGLDGRLQLSIFHTWHLQEQLVIRDGVPVLDLLNGSATGNSGGEPRHEIEARAGIGKNGLGARLSVNWQSATSVLRDPTGATTSPDDLFFSSLATVNLRLFADLGQRRSLVAKAPFFRGSRISLGIDNIADARLNVRDREGVVPINYQRDIIDPLGRTVTLSFRKLFF
ncbi:TonB-dependent receptor [Polymorphobacter glacialis]|uniref:TonB-dependent receptor n=1 Tax=Sandarakinorhabdus glacialis TaxID=1614636 RepID=A0A916ZZC5_9SPHN|nr:TonB-dependent receptor plug domain-containing protein [Polymorphobacter glacialis]GGE20029.1 TonB-dependent receptor [Polymorphobacter glacialis]